MTPEAIAQSERDWDGTAERAYELYAKSSGNQNFTGAVMPIWSALPPAIRGHWRAVVAALGVGPKPKGEYLLYGLRAGQVSRELTDALVAIASTRAFLQAQLRLLGGQRPRGLFDFAAAARFIDDVENDVRMLRILIAQAEHVTNVGVPHEDGAPR